MVRLVGFFNCTIANVAILTGLKTIGKFEAVKAQQQSAIANERWLWGALPQPQEEMVLPRLVATCISDNCLHMLFKPTMAMEFAEVSIRQ